MRIRLEFDNIVLEAELFDTKIAGRFFNNLPYTVALEKWGNEIYGPIGIDLGDDDPVPSIPPGGIAYTSNGHYVCIFFGQTPAWPVEYIGQVVDDGWKRLLDKPSFSSVTITAVQ